MLNLCFVVFVLFTDEKHPRFRRLLEAFSNPMTEVYLLFLPSNLTCIYHLKPPPSEREAFNLPATC